MTTDWLAPKPVECQFQQEGAPVFKRQHANKTGDDGWCRGGAVSELLVSATSHCYCCQILACAPLSASVTNLESI